MCEAVRCGAGLRGVAQAVQGMWPSPERPFLQNRTIGMSLGGVGCPILQNRTNSLCWKCLFVGLIRLGMVVFRRFLGGLHGCGAVDCAVDMCTVDRFE